MTTALDLMGRRPRPGKSAPAALQALDSAFREVYSTKPGTRQWMQREYDWRQWSREELKEKIAEVLRTNQMLGDDLDATEAKLLRARKRIRRLRAAKK